MVEDNLDTWWATLTVLQKERIASKYVSAKAGKWMDCLYPNCSHVWNNMAPEEKKRIHDHCTDAHGMLMSDFSEGKTFSY